MPVPIAAPAAAFTHEAVRVHWFCRVYYRPVPDASTLLRWASTIRPAMLEALLDRVVVQTPIPPTPACWWMGRGYSAG